jgi:hypothetical protein
MKRTDVYDRAKRVDEHTEAPRGSEKPRRGPEEVAEGLWDLAADIASMPAVQRAQLSNELRKLLQGDYSNKNGRNDGRFRSIVIGMAEVVR